MVKLSAVRILLLCGWYYPDSVGGTEVYVKILGKELQSLGYEVSVAAPSVDEKEHNYVYEGLSVYRYPVSLKPNRREVRGEIPPEYFNVFVSWLKKNKPDLVHMHSYSRGCGFFHAQFVKQLNIPLVLTAHVPGVTCLRGTLMRWGRVPCDGKMRLYLCSACYLQEKGIPKIAALAINAISSFMGNLSSNLEKRLGTALKIKSLINTHKECIQQLFNLADSIIVVSKWQYEIFRINGVPDSKLSLCRHGLSPELIKIRTGFDFKISNLIRIGYIGRFSPIKGVHILVEAVKRLPSDVPVELRLYGRANTEEEQVYLRRLQKISNNDKRILFCSEVTDKNCPEIFNNLDVFAAPSLLLETGPLVVLEAFAASIPVIGSNLGGIAELVTNRVNGLLVEPGNIQAWSRAIQQLCLHPELLREWTCGIPAVRSSKEVTEEMLKLYENLIT